MHKGILLVGAIMVVGASAGIASSKTESTARAPKACVAAISAARTAFHWAGDVDGSIAGALKAAADYPNLVYRAALAGENQDSAEIDQIAAKMRSITKAITASTARIKSDTKRISRLVGWFNTDAAACQ